MNFYKYYTSLMLMILNICCSSFVFAEETDRTLPMYGTGGDKSKLILNEEDHLFIKDATRTFGTTEHASEGYTERGFDLFSEKKYDVAMKHFNQSWLLNTENHYVYLGFGLLLKQQQAVCGAVDMFALAHAKGLDENGFLADYAYLLSECASTQKSEDTQMQFNKANGLFDEATKTANQALLGYIYHAWAKSYFLQKNYKQSKQMLDNAMALGANIDESFLKLLQGKI